MIRVEDAESEQNDPALSMKGFEFHRIYNTNNRNSHCRKYMGIVGMLIDAANLILVTMYNDVVKCKLTV